MRNSIGCILVLGVLGCGHNDSAPSAGQGTPQNSTAAGAITTTTPQGITPEQALAQAQELIEKQDFKAATQLLSQAIQANPEFVDAYTTRASLFADAQLYAQAVRDMDKVIRLKPDVAQYYNTRGYFSLLLENNGPAMDDFNHAIALDPNYAQPLNNRGLVRISLGGQFKQTNDLEQANIEFRKAVNELDAALRIDNKYVDAHNNRGFALSLAKQYDEAILSFTHAIELNDKYVNAWNNRGQAYAQTGQHDLAAADFTRAIELQPATLDYYQLRADAYLAAGKTDLARTDLNHLEWSYELDALNRRLMTEPKNPMHWAERGDHLRKLARWDEANKNYQDALKLDPNCQQAQVGQAHVMFQQGQLDAALAACQKILEAGPHREAMSIRGDILNQQGKLDEAIADYETAQRFDSQVAQAYLKRAEQRKAKGEIQQASADIVQAIEMDPSLRASVPDAPQVAVPTPVGPGAFPVDEAEARPIETAAPPAAESTAAVQTAEKPSQDEPAATQPATGETTAQQPTTAEPAVSPPASPVNP